MDEFEREPNANDNEMARNRHDDDLVADGFEGFDLDDSALTFASHDHDSYDLEGMLADPIISDNLDCMFMDSTPLGYDEMHVEENLSKSIESSRSKAGGNSRRNSQPPPTVQPFNDASFHPVAPQDHQHQHRRSSCNDLDMMDTPSPHQQRPSSCNDLETMEASSYFAAAPSETSKPSSSRPQRRITFDSDIAQGLGGGGHADPPEGEVSYDEALQNLADSIKRTERSRQQLMMQRAIIGGSAQQQRCHAISSAREQLQQRVAGERSSKRPSIIVGAPESQRPHQTRRIVSPVHQSFQQQHVTAAPVLSTRPISVECLMDITQSDRSSVMAAFFSGTRGTLTDGLEQSRIQLKAYMDQVNNQILY